MAAPELDTEVDIQLDTDTRIIMSDGRVFHMTEATSSRQDMWVMSRLDKAGLEAIAATYNAPNQLDELAVKLVEEAYENDTLYEILAGIMVEENVKWTKAYARAAAEYFADLTDPGDKEKIQGPIVSMLLLYFASGLASKLTSLKSSEGSDAGPEASTVQPSSETPAPDSSSPTELSVPANVLDALRAAGSTLVTGTSLSEKSAATTTTDSTKSSTGR